MMRIFKSGFNYSQDGPGNRLVIHLQGCNMFCPWCSNPEGMPSITPAGFEGKCISLEEALEFCLSCRPMFFDGGGVTLTGGEVGVQMDGAKALLEALRKENIHTAIETNASMPRFNELFPFLNLIIADLKHYDNALHHRYTGIGNEIVIENLKLAALQPFQLWIRIPLINGFNAAAHDAEGFVMVLLNILQAGGRFSVELLPYHEYGKEKWQQCGLPYKVENAFVSAEAVQYFSKVLSNAGINAIST